MEYASFFGIIQVVLTSILLFTIGIILKRHEVLLKYVGVKVVPEEADVSSFKELKGLIGLCGNIFQWFAIINVAAQFFGMAMIMFG